jgi:hypothetical protein
MRLTEDQLLEKLLHPEIEVRSAVLQSFGESFSRNPAIMSEVTAAVRQYGFRNAFHALKDAANLAQSEESVAWAVESLRNRSPELNSHTTHALEKIVVAADPPLLVPHRPVVESMSQRSPAFVDRFKRRLEFAELPNQELWRRFDALCVSNKEERVLDEGPESEAEELASALSRDPANADRALSMLGRDFDRMEPTPWVWEELYAVRIVGEMRLEAAIPALVGNLHVDDDYLLEWSAPALSRIGTDAVIHAVRAAYPNAPDHFQLFGSGVFGGIRSDLALSAGLELLALDCHTESPMWLAMAVVLQFSTEAVDAARRLLAEFPSMSDLQSVVMQACRVMDYEFPELMDWRQEQDDRRRKVANAKFREVAPRSGGSRREPPGFVVPKPAASSVTRKAPPAPDDLCPCGSGKKYKKCCRNKAR